MTATLEQSPRTATGLAQALLGRPWFAPVAAGLVGLLVSAVGITTPGVWYDEAATISSSTRSWPQLWAMVGNVDAVHALYYAVMHIVFDLFGYTMFSLRIPSALAVGATAAVIVVLGRALLRPRIGVVAALVFSVLPRVVWSGTEGRSYALTALAAVTLTLVFVLARRGGRRWWVLYSALAVVSCILFLYLAFIVLAHAVTVAWHLLRGDRWFESTARRWFTAAAAAALVTTPFALAVIAQSSQVAWIPELSGSTLGNLLIDQWFYTVPFALAAWALIAWGVVATARGSGSRPVLMLALPAMVVPTVGLLVMSVALSPIYLPRYVTMSTPFVALAIAVGIEAIRMRAATVAALLLITALAVPSIVDVHRPGAKDDGAWLSVARLITEQRAADGPGVTTAIIWGGVQRHPSASARVMQYSYPAAFAGTLDPTLRVPAAETAELWETAAPIGDSRGGLVDADVTYLITSASRDIRPEVTAVMRSEGWEPVENWQYPGVRVIRYERG